MHEFFPLIAVGAVVGVLSLIFIVAYASIKDKKAAIGFDRYMPDGEITKRLLKYAKPYAKNFALVLMVMLLSTAHDICAPLLVGQIEKILAQRGGKILESYSLFDIYEGTQIKEGYKSIAYTLTFRAKDKTLEDAEITAAMKKILNGLEQLGIELRQ